MFNVMNDSILGIAYKNVLVIVYKMTNLVPENTSVPSWKPNRPNSFSIGD